MLNHNYILEIKINSTIFHVIMVQLSCKIMSALILFVRNLLEPYTCLERTHKHTQLLAAGMYIDWLVNDPALHKDTIFNFGL